MAQMLKTQDLKEEDSELKLRENADPKVKTLMDKLRAELFRRGATGMAGLARKFRIIDDSGDGNLDEVEFAKCMKEQKLGLEPEEVKTIFKFFDEDASGTITYDEFLFGVRGEMNTRREQMVLLAFDVMDKDSSGLLDLDDITEAYNTDGNPDVLSGKKTKAQVLREFLDTFDGGEKDGKVYPNEFKRYYANLSASIDDDDYFELMIRNAWHIPGGEGWCANTANKRVLVTHKDGTQTVECINNDLGLDLSDPQAIAANLRAQGVECGDDAVQTVGKLEDDKANKTPVTQPAKKAGATLGQVSGGSAKAATKNLSKGHALQKTSIW
mmetsp:Transcript_47795/g.89051  ORF Transcript_47795/g.89051 Transcript_47795/m.89051 type:complete len:326 (+) Transcript_47795:62-1039(+)